MKVKILLVIFFQLVIIACLYITIQNKKHNILGVSVNTISTSSITRTKSHNLKYFYEPKADSTQTGEAIWLPYKALYTINKDSLNNSHDYPITKASNTYRIITLGDSFTFGQFVNTFENYPSTLENLLNSNYKCTNIKNFEVINLGVYGYDIEYEVERYRLRGIKYNPDLVLWMLEWGNFTGSNEYMQSKVDYYEKELRRKDIYSSLINNGDYYPAWRMAREDFINSFGIDKILSMQINHINEFSKLYDNRLVIFGYLNDERFKKAVDDFVKSRPNSYYYREFTDIYKTPEAVLPDKHPSTLGDKLIAQDIFGYLSKNKIIPCD